MRPGRAARIRGRRHGHAGGAGHLALGPAMGLRKEQGGVCVASSVPSGLEGRG